MNISIVEYCGEDKQKCGYCGKKDSFVLTGMWGHSLSTENYEILMNRGWRRCGNFYYKPNISESCCALYTIRADATEFTLRKSQKKILRRMRRYLIFGHPAKKDFVPSEDQSEPPRCFVDDCMPRKRLCLSDFSNCQSKSLLPPPGKQNQPKDLLFHIDSSIPSTSVHDLKVILVRSSPPCEEFTKSFDESFRLYRKYQLGVHKESVEGCTEEGFRNFLCTSSLIINGGGRNVQFGSFHMQYWLDGTLLAVGVVDILPSSLSSKYFYYDPDYSFLSLGTYSILREIAYVRQLSAVNSELRYYYMGFYVHTCPKMRYKCKLKGSYLLCPTTYMWFPFEDCLPLISGDLNCCRFTDREGKVEKVDDLLEKVNFLFRNKLVNYKHYLRIRHVSELGEDEVAEIKNFLSYVGPLCLENMYLCRPDHV